MAAMREMMQRLRLTVNEDKTRQCRVWDESFEFLGYTIGRCYSPKTGKVYIGTKPSKKKISRVCGEISELTLGGHLKTGQTSTAQNRPKGGVPGGEASSC